MPSPAAGPSPQDAAVKKQNIYIFHLEAPKHQIITPGTAKDFEIERECYRAILKIKAASI